MYRFIGMRHFSGPKNIESVFNQKYPEKFQENFENFLKNWMIRYSAKRGPFFKKLELFEKPFLIALKWAKLQMLRTMDAWAVHLRLGGGTSSRGNFYTFIRVFRIWWVSQIDSLLRRPMSVKIDIELILKLLKLAF